MSVPGNGQVSLAYARARCRSSGLRALQGTAYRGQRRANLPDAAIRRAARSAGAFRKNPAARRLQDIHELICGLIREFAPTALAIESVFTALNMRTALRLAESARCSAARGFTT